MYYLIILLTNGSDMNRLTTEITTNDVAYEMDTQG